MTVVPLYCTDRLARRTERLLTTVTVLGVIEILRRSPRWLLLGAGLLVYAVVMLVIVYMAWLEIALGVVVAWKIGRAASGWRYRSLA